MANWVTHLIIADEVMAQMSGLHRRGFCVGNIAPDCNVENEDWTAFTPSREVTHWMTGERKRVSDCAGFYNRYLANGASMSEEKDAFLLGYYTHLLTDAAFQTYIRDGARVANIWKRIKADPNLREQAEGCAETFDDVKRLIPRNVRMKEMEALEAEYLRSHPNSGYLTEILPLKQFPDYLEYMPQGCIVRKIRIMGYLPEGADTEHLISITKEEYAFFVTYAVGLVMQVFRENKLI